MCDSAWRSICPLETQSKTGNFNLNLVFFWSTETFDIFVPGGSTSSEMTTMSVPKFNWGQTNAQKTIFVANR